MIGKTIGRIRILAQLGKGGMGEVYIGPDETLDRKVALKAIRGEHRLDPKAKARFLREARVLSQLAHPSICQIFDLIAEDGCDYLVLELIEGKSLRQALDEGLDRTEALRIAARIAEVLAAAHAKGVIHRDLKPENVMLTRDGELKVLDFGIAQSEREVDTTVTLAFSQFASAEEALTALAEDSDFRTELGSIIGTPHYMSPEQAKGQRVTAASDLYSFGLLLQELLTGEPPYERGLSAAALLLKAMHGDTSPANGLDRDLTSLLERLKAVAPEARPSATEAVESLR